MDRLRQAHVSPSCLNTFLYVSMIPIRWNKLRARTSFTRNHLSPMSWLKGITERNGIRGISNCTNRLKQSVTNCQYSCQSQISRFTKPARLLLRPVAFLLFLSRCYPVAMALWPCVWRPAVAARPKLDWDWDWIMCHCGNPKFGNCLNRAWEVQCMSGIPTSLRHTNVYSLKRQFFRLKLITTHSKHSTDPLAGRAGFKTHARFRERMVKRCDVAALGNGRQFIVCQWRCVHFEMQTEIITFMSGQSLSQPLEFPCPMLLDQKIRKLRCCIPRIWGDIPLFMYDIILHKMTRRV